MIRRGIDTGWKLVWFIILLIPIVPLSAQRVVWDVTTEFGVTVEDAKPGTDLAIEAVRNHFVSSPNDTIVLYFPEGSYDFHGDDHALNFDSGLIPGSSGRLEIIGDGCEKTVFIAKNREMHSINGREVYRILFRGIHFTRDYNTVLQGDVVSVSKGEVIMDLHEGFPTPDSLLQYGIVGGWGLYLKRYTNDPDDPQIILDNNGQVAWTDEGTYEISGRRWRFALNNPNELPSYKEGDVIGVKLKHGGQTYWFHGGDDIVFESCKWTQKSRGVLRGGISNIRFSDCVIERAPRVGGRVPCLASPGGGPQCGQPNDERIKNVIVENCRVEATGDDNVAFFNVDGGVIRNCYFSDGFARGVLLYQSTYICMENNTFVRCAPLWEGGDSESNCTTPDFEAPTQPQNLTFGEISSSSVKLSWESSTDNIGVSHYSVYMGANEIGVTVDTTYTVSGLNPTVYYVFRVQAVDSAGNRSTFSKNLGVTTPEESDPTFFNVTLVHIDVHLSVYPNPFKDRLTVVTGPMVSGGMIRIYNTKGSLVFQKLQIGLKTEIAVPFLAPGIYYLEIRNENSRDTRTIVK